jgi:hypothetical protein
MMLHPIRAWRERLLKRAGKGHASIARRIGGRDSHPDFHRILANIPD